ncbi:MAG: ATP-binding cassette domain-containing protein, partial [Deinococcus sp.]
ELRGVMEGVAAAGVALVLATHHPEEAPELNWRRLELEGGRLRPHDGGEGGRREQGGGAAQTLAVPFPSRAVQDAPPLVTLEGASVYRNGQLALGPLDWVWREGQHWLLTGENGAGKSTFARLLAGEFHPALGGRVVRHFLENRSPGRDLLSERRRHIGAVGAELGIRGRRPWSGFELVASGFGGSEGFAPELTPAQSARLYGLTGRLDLEPLLAGPADTLSQGQLARLPLARAVVHRPRLLILDEGLNFLDATSRGRVLGLLPELMSDGTHLLVVAHRLADALPGLTHHLHLEGGLIRD